jgi:hypothetical protein
MPKLYTDSGSFQTLDVTRYISITGSYVLSGSHEISGSQFISGSSSITGSLAVTGSLTLSGSANGNVISMSIVSSTASLDLNAGSYFTLLLANSTTTHIRAVNIKPGLSAILRVITGTNSSASLASNLLQPSGSSYTASFGSNKIDILSFISFDSSNMYVVSSKEMQ